MNQMGAWFEWASLGIGAGGLVASIVGVVYALLARRAAKSAESAANEARNSVSQTLCLVSAQRALSIIVRLRTLHREQRWEAAIELYRELRTLLNDVRGMTPENFHQHRSELDTGLGQFRVIQALVQDAVSAGRDPAEFPALGETLNSLENVIESLISSMMPPIVQEGEPNG